MLREQKKTVAYMEIAILCVILVFLVALYLLKVAYENGVDDKSADNLTVSKIGAASGASGGGSDGTGNSAASEPDSGEGNGAFSRAGAKGKSNAVSGADKNEFTEDRIFTGSSTTVVGAGVSNPSSVSEKIVTLPDSCTIKFTVLGGGTFEAGGFPVWKTFIAKIEKPFALSQTEITRAQFAKFAVREDAEHSGKSGNAKVDENLPVSNVSWDDCVRYCAALTDYLKSTRQIAPDEFVRLPSEFEWEYAAKSEKSYGDFDAWGWSIRNSKNALHPVGLLKKSTSGFFDMHGNVAEWCADSFDESGAKPYVEGLNSGNYKVIKGGDFGSRFTMPSERGFMRRDGRSFRTGFRVVISK